jgi:hypothetical protein
MKKFLIIVLILGFIVSIGFNVIAGYKRIISISLSDTEYKMAGGFVEIIKDKNTGVCYLIYNGRGTAITPMYDSNGKVLVEK